MSRRLLVLPLLLSILAAGAAARLAAGATPSAIPTIATSANPKTAGSGLIVSGRVPNAGAGVAVTLWQRLPGRPQFGPGPVVATDTSGHYAFSLDDHAADTNRSLYVVAAGHRSRTVLELVHALITVTTSSGSVNAGEVVRSAATSLPNHSGQRILFERITPVGGLLLARPGSAARTSRSDSGCGPSAIRRSGRCWRATPQHRSASQAAIVSVGAQGIHKIQHVVIIMQENRSFDTYFGTYPGADGIPAGVCVPDPRQRRLRVLRSTTRQDVNYGGPHGARRRVADIDGGSMDGFVGQAEHGARCTQQRPELQPVHPGRAEQRASM